MIWKRPLLIVAFCAALAALPFPRESSAFGGMNAAPVIAAITALQAALTNIIQNLMSVNLANVGATASAETTRQIAATRQIAQGEVAAMVHLAMERARADAAENAMPSPMWEEAATTTLLIGSQERVNRNRTIDRAAMLVERSARPRPLNDIADLHFAYFCPGQQRDAGMCTTSVHPTLQLTNVSVGALLNPGDGQYETLSTNEIVAAELLTETITMPRVDAPIAVTPGAGEIMAGLSLADRAALSASSYSFASMISSRERKHATSSAR